MSSRRAVRAASVAFVAAGCVAIALPAGAATPAGPSAAAAAAVATPKLGPGGRVIVVLRDQATAPASGSSTGATKTATAKRTALVNVIRHGGFTVTHLYSITNAVAATVSQAEANSLAADSDVAEVIPDSVISAAPSAQATAATVEPPTTAPAGTCDANGQVKLEPEALEATRADSDVAGAKTARSLGFTGAGVTVGYIADGLDPNNPDFLRNGHSIFTDYEDFSGEGTNAPSGGDEAFLDASAIAAQGNKTYDVSKFSDLPLNAACNIRIEGEAPGVNLVGLNIFGDEDAGFNSSFLQAIDYAVMHDHVNVLNESLGSNLYPDDAASLDLIKSANDAAVRAGTTVTVSSGDAGVTNTIGTPSTDPLVLSVGGSTTYQFYLATGYGGGRLPGITGWLNNNISSLSSGGVDQAGGTVSLVAPGDLNYALCSTDLTKFSECGDFAGKAIGVEESGGTSESAPVTAGVAALVIQAYRAGHAGATPTPAVVKDILTSSADDIQAPADEQGAGLVDAYKAVELAKSFGPLGTATGETISSSASQLNAVASANSTASFTDTVTNRGTSAQTLSVSSRTLGAYTQVKSTSVTLSDTTSAKYVDFQGLTDNYETVKFTVPAGKDRLETSLAFQNASATDLAARVRLDLVDPDGRLASYSVPQGNGNYGHVEVADPLAGTWTAYVQSRDSAEGGTEGLVLFASAVANYHSFGTVTPSSVTLAPGQSSQVALWIPTKSVPGDETSSLVLSTPAAGATTVPVVARSVIPSGSESFTDSLTGGNGREATTGQTAYYYLDVPSGKPELNADVTLADNPNNQFYDELVSPSGDALAFGSNNELTSSGTTPIALSTLGSQLHVLNPAAGRWTVIVAFVGQVSGVAISEQYTVATSQTAVPAASLNLPNSASTVLHPGQVRTAYVSVKNTGTSPEAFFVDPRSTASTTIALAPQLGSNTTTEPVNVESNEIAYSVPTETTAIAAAATTTGPADIQADLGWNLGFGDPDVGTGIGTTVATGYVAPRVAQGLWAFAPTEVGPFPTPGATETVTTAMFARTRAFDTSVSSSTGDLWSTSVDPTATTNLITVDPGETAVIPVRITASGPARTVSGTIFLDDASLFDVFGDGFANGNEVAALPYSYSVR